MDGVTDHECVTYQTMSCLEPGRPIDEMLAQLDAELSFIESMIQQLKSRQLHLLRKRNALCPIAKLPADILINIFQIACESTYNTDQPIIPLLFGGICKDWRQIAWSTPLLWGTVSIHVSERPRSKVDLLRDWLLRAQSTPLSIYLTLGEECRRGAEPFGAIFELLVTRVKYWQTFDCVLPLSAKYENVLQDQEFPLLSSLALRSAKYYPLRTISLDAPQLVRIEFSSRSLRRCNLTALPLGQLRCFKTNLSSIEVAQVFELLRCAPALTECYINYFDDEGPTPSQVLHTKLELLYLSEPCFVFLDSLTLPKLRVFIVGNSLKGINGERLYNTISSLVSRSSCHLERLEFEVDDSFMDDMIISLLEALPSLTHFCLSSFDHSELPLSHGLSDKLVSRLRPSEHGSCLLPKLTSLKFRGPVPCDNRLLIAMLSERWYLASESEGGQGMSRLLGAKIISRNRFYKDLSNVRADIDVLVSEGMQLEIQDYLDGRNLEWLKQRPNGLVENLDLVLQAYDQ